jgi:hypothetical protein
MDILSTTHPAPLLPMSLVGLIPLLIWLGIISPLSAVQRTNDNNFDLVTDFQNKQATFQTDTVDITDKSTDGGKLITFKHKHKDYQVVDIWLFGELGKMHATYWLDKSGKTILVKRSDFEYDKPYYEVGFKSKETIRYLSYKSDKVIGYNNERQELNAATSIMLKNEYEAFFKEMTNGKRRK